MTSNTLTDFNQFWRRKTYERDESFPQTKPNIKAKDVFHVAFTHPLLGVNCLSRVPHWQKRKKTQQKSKKLLLQHIPGEPAFKSLYMYQTLLAALATSSLGIGLWYVYLSFCNSSYFFYVFFYDEGKMHPLFDLHALFSMLLSAASPICTAIRSGWVSEASDWLKRNTKNAFEVWKLKVQILNISTNESN